jgi:hypothetical protein
LVGGKKSAGGVAVTGLREVKGGGEAPRRPEDAAAQRRKHAEQLVAMGVELPEELKREVLGVGGWQTIAETVVESEVKQERSLADILKQEQEVGDSKEGVVLTESESIGVRKRKAEDEEGGVRDEEAAPPRTRMWGSTTRRYAGADDEEVDVDALLSGVIAKKVKQEQRDDADESGELKKEDSTEEKPLDAIPDVQASAASLKQEDGAGGEEVVPAVVFKKRKGKR